jgi:hypothetical protein
LLLATTGIILFTYIFLRSFLVSFTHDESLTVLEYVVKPWSVINHVTYTNNHLFNSWCAKICFNLFGYSEAGLRLPNVLAGGLFFLYAAKLVRRIFSDGRLMLIAYMLICINEFVLDFFGLCRGYGISVGLLMTAVYFLYRYFESPKKNRAFALLSVLLMGIAMLANYTFFTLFVMHAGIILLFEIRFLWTHIQLKKKEVLKAAVFPAMIFLIACLAGWKMLGFLLSLKQTGSFDFGGHEGFWKDSVRSLGELSCATIWFGLDQTNVIAILIRYCVFAGFLTGTVVLIDQLRRRIFTPATRIGIYLVLILTGTGIATYATHLVFDFPYATDRAIIYLILLFALFAVVTLLPGSEVSSYSRLLIALIYFLPFISFLVSVNFHHTVLWRTNAEMKATMESVRADAAQEKGTNKFVTVTYMQYPSYNFYCCALDMREYGFLTYEETEFRQGANYFIGNKDPGTKYRLSTEHDTLWKLMQPYNDIEFHMLPEPGEYGRSGVSGNYIWQTDSAHEHAGIIRDTIRERIPAGTIVRLDYSLFADRVAVDANINFSIRNDGGVYLWRSYAATLVITNENKWCAGRQFLVLQKDVLPGDIVEGVMWSNKETPARLKNFTIVLIQRRFPG